MAKPTLQDLQSLIDIVTTLVAEGNINPDNAESSDDRDWLALDWGDSHFEFGIEGGKISGLMVNVLQDRTSDEILTDSLMAELARIDRESEGTLVALLLAGNTSLGKKAAQVVRRYRQVQEQAEDKRQTLDAQADRILAQRPWVELISGVMTEEGSFEDSLNVYLAEVSRAGAMLTNLHYQASYSPVVNRTVHNALIVYVAAHQITWDQAIERHNELVDDERASAGFIMTEEDLDAS